MRHFAVRGGRHEVVGLHSIMVRGARSAFATALLLVGSGCASDKNAATFKPAELTAIISSVPVREVWRLNLGGSRGEFLQPAITDNAIYAASGDGRIFRIEPDTGREVWRVDAEMPISAGVGSDGFTTVVASSRGEVVAFGVDGKTKWRSTVTSDVTAAPLVGKSLVVVRSTDHRVTAFDADTGKRRWSFQRAQPPLTVRAIAQMAFAGDNVLVGLPGGHMVALAQSNGLVRWDSAVAEARGSTEVERLVDILGTIALAEREACAAAFQSRVACVDLNGGTLRWFREIPAATGVAVDAANVYAIDNRANVYALAREANGASLWRADALRNRRLSGPLSLPRAVVVGDFQGFVHFLSPRDGSLLGRVATDGSAIVVPPQRWSDAAVLVQTSRGALVLLQLGG